MRDFLLVMEGVALGGMWDAVWDSRYGIALVYGLLAGGFLVMSSLMVRK